MGGSLLKTHGELNSMGITLWEVLQIWPPNMVGCQRTCFLRKTLHESSVSLVGDSLNESPFIHNGCVYIDATNLKPTK